MKILNLNTGLVESLVGEIVSRIAEGTPGVKDTTLPREALKRFRAMTPENREAWGVIATEADADLLERLLDAEEADEPAPADAQTEPVVIKLTPRLSAALRWEAMIFDRTPEVQAIIHIAECVKATTGDFFANEEDAVSWLKEGSAAEGILEAYLKDCNCGREEVAS